MRIRPIAVPVALMAVFMTVEAATFTKIIGPSDPFPDEAHTVRQIREAVFDESGSNQFLVVLHAGLDPDSFQALYRVNAANQFHRIAAAGAATSRGPAISGFGDYTSHGATVYFVAFDSAFNHHLCKVTEPGGAIQVIAAKGDIAGEGLRFEGFLGGISAYAGGLVFDGLVQRTQFSVFYNDLFQFDGSAITSLIGFGKTPVPEASGARTGAVFYMNKATGPTVRNGEIAFLGEGLLLGAGPVGGLYAMPLAGGTPAPRKIASTQDKAPGSAQTLSVIGRSQAELPLFAFDNGEAAFFATSFQNADIGFYRHTPSGGIAAAVNRDSVAPGSNQKFPGDSLAGGHVALSGRRMVFRAHDELGNDGVYLHHNGVLETLIVTGTEVNGESLNFFTLHRRGLSGDQLVFLANFSLYRTTFGGGGGPSPTPVSIQITRTGDQVTISWDPVGAGPKVELQTTGDLAAPDWQKVSAQANPFSINPTTAGAQYFRLKQ